MKRKEFMRRFETLSQEDKEDVIILTFAYLLKRLREQQSERINPEQVAVEDQERVDAVAGELLDSVNWGSHE